MAFAQMVTFMVVDVLKQRFCHNFNYYGVSGVYIEKMVVGQFNAGQVM